MHTLNIGPPDSSGINGTTGFSLVELMVVIAILGIIAAATVPSVMNWQTNQRCKAAARDIYSNLQQAKVTAIKTNRNCAVTFNQPVAGITYDYILYTDTNANSRFDAGDSLMNQIRFVDAYPGVQFDTSDPEGTDPDNDGLTFLDNGDPAPGIQPTIAFRPNSVPTDSGGGIANGTVYIRNGNGLNYRISVSQAGNIAIENLL